jgi:hypothetical protein
MKLSPLLSIVAAASLVGLAAPAQALTFNLSSGIAGPNGETNQGSYSEFSQQEGFVTVDFNNGTAPSSGFASYSFVDTSRGGSDSYVTYNKWAPDGSNNEVNRSTYLQVFSGQDVVIEFTETLNYFGINWGSESPGNIFSFYLDDQEVGRFGIEDVDFEQIGSLSNQGTGYLDFRAESSADVFNKIVISQYGGGGFETDNHTFRAGSGGFDAADVPEPSILAGLLILGGMVATKRQRSTSAI